MKTDDDLFPAVTEIMEYLFSLPKISPPPPKHVSRANCENAMSKCKIQMPLGVEEASIWLLLIHSHADYDTCLGVWSYYNDRSLILKSRHLDFDTRLAA